MNRLKEEAPKFCPTHPEQIPGKDKETNWLPAPKGPFCHGHAPLLAESRSAGRQVDRAAGEEDAIRVQWMK